MSINVVSISGNLTRDAELKATKSGTLTLTGSIAVNDRVKDAQGNWTDKPNFVDWVLFGPRAEKIVGYLTKGTKVAIVGRLSYSSWTDQQTNKKRSKLEVVVTEIEFFRPSNVVMDAPTAVQAAKQPPQPLTPANPYQQAPQQMQAQMSMNYQ